MWPYLNILPVKKVKLGKQLMDWANKDTVSSERDTVRKYVSIINVIFEPDAETTAHTGCVRLKVKELM